MYSTRDIWEAGRAALGLPVTIEPSAPAPAPAVAPAPPAADDIFAPASYPFRAGAYRIHFKNGFSGEYEGSILASAFPFDVREVLRVEPVEEVGR